MSMKARLLVVEDEADLNDLLCSEFKSFPIEVDSARDGEVAFELVKLKRYDTILSDIAMPKMDGLSLLSAVRSINLDLPFVILSAFGDRERVFEALRLGATDFLDKPFEVARLHKTVLMALEMGVKRRAVLEILEQLAESGKDEAKEALRVLKELQSIAYLRALSVLPYTIHSQK